MADAKDGGGGEGETRAMVRIRADQALYSLIATLFLGIGIGWVIGHTQGAASTQARVDAARSAEPAAETQAAPADSPMLAYELATRVDSLESLLATANAHRLAPRVLVERAISQLSDSQIRAVLGPVVQLDPDEIEAIGDLPAYASRMADLALAGLIEPDEDPTGQGVGEVVFAVELDRRDPESLAATSFPTDTGRIYAIFDVEEYSGSKVMVKWYRTDDPELLLFRHFRLNPDEQFSWVWRGRANGWDPGRYRVDVYSGDENLERVATGEFDVR